MFGAVPAATQHGARRQLDALEPSRAREHHRPSTWPYSSGTASTGFEVLGERDALLERLDDLLVVQPVGGRVLQALAVGERDAAPRADQRR